MAGAAVSHSLSLSLSTATPWTAWNVGEEVIRESDTHHGDFKTYPSLKTVNTILLAVCQ